MGTTRKYCLQAWHCVTSPCKSCKNPSVNRYSARSRRAFFLSRAPQCGQMNSTVSCCGSRSRAAQPVRRTPTVSRLCRPMRSEEHTSELQSRQYLVCRLLLEKKTNEFSASINESLHALS